MSELVHCAACYALVAAAPGLLLVVGITARRLGRARRGEARLLLRRGRILRVYRRRRDGRIYDPIRNPDIAALFDRDR